MKKWIACFLAIVMGCSLLLSGCSDEPADVQAESSDGGEYLGSFDDSGGVQAADTSEMDFSISDEDVSALAPEVSSTGPGSPETEDYVINSGGVYTLTGEIIDRMVTVDAKDADVTLILNGVTVKNSGGPALYVRSADKVTVTLADGTTNTLSDGSSYALTDNGSTLDAAIFSKADLTINGSGTLVLDGNYKHGIVSKDDLVISSGTLQVTSKKVGLNGKDCVKINGGNITVIAGSDGIRSDNSEDASRGDIDLSGGKIDITAGNDGVQAETVLKIDNVDLTVKAGGGSSGSLSSSSESYKGLKAGSALYITGGSFVIDSKDDCIHSNGTILISGGTYTLSSGDDGVHADTDLEISGAETNLSITKSYEGIEAANLVIKGGTISIVATDDGLNAAGGNNGSSAGRPGMGHFSSSTGTMVISGGDIYIRMGGDGVDANGSITMTGGTITISGANSGDTSILDFDTTGSISGGTFIGTGASGMAQNFSTSSTQGSIMVTTGTQAAGTVITLRDADGNVLLTHTAEQAFSCVIISHASIVKGAAYTLTVGSSATSIIMTDIIYGTGGFGGGGPGGGFGGGPGGRR